MTIPAMYKNLTPSYAAGTLQYSEALNRLVASMLPMLDFGPIANMPRFTCYMCEGDGMYDGKVCGCHIGAVSEPKARLWLKLPLSREQEIQLLIEDMI